MFKEIADIKTSDQLKLPVPEAEYETVVLKPTEQQKEIVESLGERAEVVRNGGVDASVDNMLKITNDGRKLAFGKLSGETGRSRTTAGNGSGADDKCQRGSREAISKRRGTEPKTGAAVRIKCTSQYG